MLLIVSVSTYNVASKLLKNVILEFWLFDIYYYLLLLDMKKALVTSSLYVRYLECFLIDLCFLDSQTRKVPKYVEFCWISVKRSEKTDA